MAQGNHQGNSQYKHWLRAGIALKYLREGLIPLVESTVKQQHNDMLSDMHGINSTGCGICTLKTLLPNHTKDQNGRCSMGQKFCNCINPKGKTLCPTKFCSSMYDKIIAQHRYSSPNWRNTDIRHWHDNHWEIAKCNISDGYDSKQSAEETDCSGLLQIIINDLALHSRINCPIDPPHDIFSKTRKARDTIFHSPTLELDEKDATKYVEDMINILDDKMFLRENTVSQIAKSQLEKIKDSSFDLTWKEEKAIILEAKKAIQEEKQEAIEAIKQKQNEVICEIEASSEEEKKAIERLSKEAEELEKRVTSNKAACDEVTLKITDIENRQQLLEETVESLRNNQKETNANISKIMADLLKLTSDLDSLKSHNCQDSMHNQRLKYLTAKQDLQKKLVQIYETYHTKVSILPMIPEEKEDISKIFVQPNCFSVGDKQHGKAIRSFKDIFYCAKKRNRKIYISGEAGIGKTIFCKNIIGMWCQAISNDARMEEKPQEIRCDTDKESDQAIMKQFHFLFFVSLKEANKFSNIAEMVKDQLLAGEDDFVQETADKILLSDECLVILDGLDEWSPPAGTTHSFMNTNVPLISPLANSTIVTTTRPWKIITTSLTSSDMDIHIEINHGYSTISRIADIIVGYLNQKYHRSKTSNTFMTSLLRDHKSLGVEKMPIMLTQLLCIWHDEGSIGHSLCDIYGNMTALFLRRLTPKSAAGSQCLPRCLNTKCNDYQHLLLALARLAFATLFPPHGQSCISFDRDMIKKSGFTDEDINLCLTTGILTESKLTGIYASKRHSRISFVHKSFQEFFSALYLYSYKEIETGKQLNKSESSKVLSNQQLIYSVCNKIDKIIENEKLFIFISGMDPSLAVQLLEEVYAKSDNSTEVTEYRVSIQDSTLTAVSHIQSLVLGCLTEMSARDDLRLETKVKLADIKVDPYDQSTQLNLLNIRTGSIKSVWYTGDTSGLNPELVHNLGKCKMLQKIKINADLDDKIFETLLINSIYTLKCLVIINQRNNLNPNMTQMFHLLPGMKMLQSLELCHTKLRHSNVEKLFDYLRYNDRIRELSLKHLACFEHDVNCAEELMILKCENLKRISLSGFNFNTRCLEAPKIEYLELMFPKGQNSYERILFIRWFYPEWPALNTFICSLNVDWLLCDLIPHLSSLKQLELQDISFQRELDLKANSKLEILRLIWCTLSHKTALSIAETISTMNHPVTLYFGKCILRTDPNYHGINMIKKSLSHEEASKEEHEPEIQGTTKKSMKTEENVNLETVSYKEETRQKNMHGSERENEVVKIQGKEQTVAQSEGEHMDATNWKLSNVTNAEEELEKLLTSWDLEDSNMVVIFKAFDSRMLDGLFEWNPPDKM